MSVKSWVILVLVVSAGIGCYVLYGHVKSIGYDKAVSEYSDSLRKVETKWRAFAAEQIKNSLNQALPITIKGNPLKLTDKERATLVEQINSIVEFASQNDSSLRAIIAEMSEPQEAQQSGIVYEDDLIRTEWGFAARYTPIGKSFTVYPTVAEVDLKGVPHDTVVVRVYKDKPFIEGIVLRGDVNSRFRELKPQVGASIYIPVNINELRVIPNVGYHTLMKANIGIGLEYQLN